MKWYHNIYSEEVLEEMQKEAERRVEESRERARLLAGGSFPQSATAPEQKKPPGESFSPQSGKAGGGFPIGGCPPPGKQSFFPPQFSPPGFAPPPPAGSFCSGGASPQNPFSAISEMLGGFGGDKLIIIAVLWLLWNEHADAKLLLALVYIML